MKRNDGFRIEVSPKSKLGKRLANLSVFLRNRSDAIATVKGKRFCAGSSLGYVEGVWTVRKSGVISFKGTSAIHGDVEFVYGKLSIGRNLDKPGHQETLPARQATKLLLTWIDAMFPYLSVTPLTLDSKITIY